MPSISANGDVSTNSSCKDAEQLFGYFSAGPSKLPDEIMKKAQQEFLSYQNGPVGVLELSHRSKEYMAINDDAISSLRRLFNVPNNYKIVFMHGGGTGQFAAVPLNLLPEGDSYCADYCVTGTWSDKSFKEAKKFGRINNVSPVDNGAVKYSSIPDESSLNRSKDASYFYYCDNETVHGIEFASIPNTDPTYSHIPIVADMSSNFGTRVFDINSYGMVYAAVQKNLGPAGCTIAIIREDLLGKTRKYCPSILDYNIMVKDNSIHNTPATFSVYMTKLMCDWIESNGGIVQMEKWSKTKSSLLYSVIDQSNGFYTSLIPATSRSRCNVVFRVKNGDEDLEKKFLNTAKQHNLHSLSGHRSVGGMRASIYNAISIPMVEKLANFMKEFQQTHS